jgi:putative ABC transport system permease protein
MLTNFDSTFIQRENNFKNEVRQLTGVAGAATADRLAGNEMGRVFNVHRADDNSGTKYVLRRMGVDNDFVGLYGVRVIAGRSFEPSDYNYHYESLHSVLLTVSATRLLGFRSAGDAIGRQISMYDKKWDVVGVVNDFHQKSLRYALEPTILQPFYGSYNWISVKVNAADVRATMAAVKKKYEAFFPGNPFDYFFLDERFNQQYKNDQLFGTAFALFAGFAILIACLGLLGLALFGTSQRIKEIGVRKVLGASVTNIVLLLSKDFVILIGIAFLIAAPVAWLIMHQWLQDFAYRIRLSPWIFAAAGMLATLIALVTISWQAIRAAMSSPVNSLRAE